MSAQARLHPPVPTFPVEGAPAAQTAAARAFPEGPVWEIVRAAESLRIPWDRILREEIQAEQALRRHVPDVDAEMPLATALSILPSSFLRSWRVRDQIQAFSCEARGASFRSAIRQLRAVFRCLAGQVGGRDAVFSGHLWMAYQRVLLLQRVCRAARQSKGTNAERMAAICEKARCSFDDAAWALCLEGSPRPGHRLDAAVKKARDEGFQLPRAATEARAFAKLRRIVRASPSSPPRRVPSRSSRDRVSVPARVELPVA